MDIALRVHYWFSNCDNTNEYISHNVVGCLSAVCYDFSHHLFFIDAKGVTQRL